jgi:hypothetical protein
MAVHIKDRAQDDVGKYSDTVFLYTLKPGCATSSFAVRTSVTTDALVLIHMLICPVACLPMHVLQCQSTMLDTM